MVKQATQTCTCGQAIIPPEGEIKTTCSCGAVWQIDNGGYWFTQTLIAPFVARTKPNHYEKYMKKRRKAGKKC